MLRTVYDRIEPRKLFDSCEWQERVCVSWLFVFSVLCTFRDFVLFIKLMIEFMKG